MADIKLGQSIAGSLISSDLNLNGSAYDEYDIADLDTFRQVKINLERPSGVGKIIVRVVNSATGAVLNEATSLSDKISLNGTSFPGINYKIQVIGEKFGDYQLSLTDGGRASSIVSSLIGKNSGQVKIRLGTIGTSGTFSPLASSSDNFSPELLSDIALSPTGKLYAIGNPNESSDTLYRIDPGVISQDRIRVVDTIKTTQGVALNDTLNALEFTTDNKLYAIGSGSNKLYQIDVSTSIATAIADLPTGFTNSGDLVFDAANSRFLAVSQDTSTSDALWQIPLANPSGATKIGQIGFVGVQGINFENNQLTGFTNTGSGENAIANRIKINSTSGIGTFDRSISNGLLGGISGAATIDFPSIVVNPTPILNPIITPNIGSKSQGLPGRNTIDLTEYQGQTLKADITTQGQAAYTNNIAFYVVQDALLGTIKLDDGTFLKPSDVNYALEAAKNAFLPAGKIDSKLDQNISGGNIYAPIVIAQGSLTDFITKNPTNGGGAKDIHAYFNYSGANSDKVDHFRFLGNNNFGVEDMYGGGDRDFNDIVVNVNIRIN
jgi:Domain of unknown function (DUF4114)